MSIPASPPPMQYTNAENDKMADDIDNQIADVRAQIHALSQRQRLLASTLMSTTQVQAKLNDSAPNGDLETLIDDTKHNMQTNVYRLGFGVTAFPFTDPNPETSKRPLLGIRFDVCQRNGQFDSPYYILCKRVNDDSSELRIHRHTIPALVPLQDYEEKYLSSADEGYGSNDSIDRHQQDLHAFVQQVRSDLISWRLRQEAIALIREKLGFSDFSENHKLDNLDMQDVSEDMVDATEGLHGIRDFSAVAVDAQFARIVWTNGRVGRIRISSNGIVDRAVVFGNINGQEERCKDVERLLTTNNSTIEDLIDRLQKLHEQTLSE